MNWLMVTLVQLVFALLMYAMGSIFFGIALTPSLIFIYKIWHISASWGFTLRMMVMGISLALGYFLFGLSLIFLVGLFRTILRIRLKEGNHPLLSFEAMKWAFVSALYLMINFTFIEFVLLTPFANVLYRMLGATLGKNVQFNSKHVYDASLIEIGDNTVVGGGSIILGHIVERGVLKLKKVKIGSNVTIGSHSTIMPGCEIGDKAVIGASVVLLKDTKVEARDVWFGPKAESMRHKAQERS